MKHIISKTPLQDENHLETGEITCERRDIKTNEIL